MYQPRVPATCTGCMYQLHGNRVESKSKHLKEEIPPKPGVSECHWNYKFLPDVQSWESLELPLEDRAHHNLCVMLCLSFRGGSGCSLFTASGTPGSHHLPHHVRCYNPSLCYMCESLEVNKTVSMCRHPLQWHRLLEGPCFLFCLPMLLFLLLFFLLIYIMDNNL